MPANNWPNCLRAPASIASPHKTYLFQLLNEALGAKTGTISKPKIKGDETNETIDDITRKNSAPITLRQQRNANAEQESEHAEAVLPPLHYPARRGLHPGLFVRPERLAPRPARFRFDDRARSGRLQHQERRRGLCDP